MADGKLVNNGQQGQTPPQVVTLAPGVQMQAGVPGTTSPGGKIIPPTGGSGTAPPQGVKK